MLLVEHVDTVVYQNPLRAMHQHASECQALLLFEAEIVMRPVEALLLTAGGSYTDAQFTSIAEPYRLASAAVPGDPKVT